MKKNFLSLIQTVLFVLIGCFIILIITYLGLVPNVKIQQQRTAQGVQIIENVTCTEIEDTKAPVGIVKEFRFVLDENLEHDTTLAFYLSHHCADIFLDGEEVYSLHLADEVSMIRTTGRNWVMIPIYAADGGKEVCVRLTPVYENYADISIQFMLGSMTTLFVELIKSSLPELIVSLTVVLTGVLMLGIALYNTLKKGNTPGGTYGLAMLAISSGLWRFSDTRLSPFIGNGKTIMMYYISVLMLMMCVISMMILAGREEQEKGKNLIRICTTTAAFICVVQLIFQLFGILDIRESLSLVHGMLAIGALFLIGIGIYRHKEDKYGNYAWILGAGILIDLIFYYVKGSAFGLVGVLVTILCYVLLESARLIRAYWKQKHLLEEKETQLVLSRITTMYSQIRSHFVFNILNAISGMCKYDPEKADETVVRFSRYLRNNINIMEDDNLIPFAKDLQHLEDYFLLEQVRFGEKIEFVTDIEVENFMIPPLILQPLVENAIKHGLTKSPKGGIIMLRTWQEEDQIFISIEDDGVGFDKKELEKEDSVGLKNIQFRLKHLMKGTLEIESELGKGTKATITIPGKEAGLCV